MRLHSAADQRDGHRKSCCTLDAADDARRIADHLGIPFHIQNLEQEFADAVLEPFVAAYQSGETPSPCVGCNTAVKFGALVGKGSALFGCEAVATGHYARAVNGELHRGADDNKDQTYFLWGINRDVVKRLRIVAYHYCYHGLGGPNEVGLGGPWEVMRQDPAGRRSKWSTCQASCATTR